MFYNLLSNEKVYFSDTFEPFAIWGTVAVVLALIVAWLLVFLFKKEISGKVAKNMLIGLVIYSLVLGIFLLVLEICKKYDGDYLDKNWVNKDIINFVFLPLLITAVLSLISTITLFFVSKKKPNLFRPFAIAVSLIITCSVIVSVVLIYLFYANNIVGDGYYTDEEYGNLNNLALYLSVALLIAISVILAFVLGKNDKGQFDTKCIAIAGVCVSLSFALSYIKLFELPYGGSITLFSMLPIMLFSYIYGMKKGLIVGVLYGILQAIQDPFIVHPAQFLLDYPIAFAMMGYAGSLTSLSALENKPRLKFTLSALIAGFLRWVCHVLSGVFAFGAYALDAAYDAEGIFSVIAPFENAISNFWAYSTIYNCYVFIDVLLVVVAGILLFSSKAFNNEIGKIKLNTIKNK